MTDATHITSQFAFPLNEEDIAHWLHGTRAQGLDEGFTVIGRPTVTDDWLISVEIVRGEWNRTIQRIGVATPAGKYHLAYGNPPSAICRYGLSLTGTTEDRDTAKMPRHALCLRCWPTTGQWAISTGGTS